MFQPGCRVGRYELVSRLPVGRSREVWLARRDDEGRARVALASVPSPQASTDARAQLLERALSVARDAFGPSAGVTVSLLDFVGHLFLVFDATDGHTLETTPTLEHSLSDAVARTLEPSALSPTDPPGAAFTAELDVAPAPGARVASRPPRPPEVRVRAEHAAPAADAPPPPVRPRARPEPPDPGMLDVRALVAARSSVSPHTSAPTTQAPAPSRAEHDGSTASKGDGPERQQPNETGVQRPLADGPPRHRSRRGTAAAFLTIVAVALFTALVILFPHLLKSRIVTEAHKLGVELTIARVSVGFGGFTLREVTATSRALPGVSLRADEVFALGLSAREVRISGLDITLDGGHEDVLRNALAFFGLHRALLARDSGELRKVSAFGAHLRWVGIAGEGSSLEAHDVGLESEARAPGREDVHGLVSRLELRTKEGAVGPWALSLDRSVTQSRLRLLFDPSRLDGPSALAVFGPSPTHVEFRVPREPLSRLGMQGLCARFGWPADTEVELKFDGGLAPNGRVEAAGRVDVFHVLVRGFSSPVDLSFEGSASGPPGKPLELQNAHGTVGPLGATVAGSVVVSDTSIHVAATWRTIPISCERLVHNEAKALGPLAQSVEQLARATRLAKVTGSASASGRIEFDSESPDTATATILTRETCGLSIFGM